MKKKLIALLLAFTMVIPAGSGFTVKATEGQTETKTNSNTMAWDFSDDTQNTDFTFYQDISTSAFLIEDGTLKAGGSGEMKAIINTDIENIKQVSVDIIPGELGVSAGVYLGATDAGNTRDEINALAFVVESAFTGWADAPNRIDIVTGIFKPWNQLDRMVSETGKYNALYSNGNKQPLNLKLDFDDDNITVTLSLRDNSSKCIQTVYYCDTSEIIGKVGLRADRSDVAFDNLTITCQATTEEEPIYTNEGFCFKDGKEWRTTDWVNSPVRTVEAWVKVPTATADSSRLIIASASPAAKFQMEIYTEGRPSLYYADGASIRYTADVDVRTNKWTHIAWVCDDTNSNVTCYINGEAVYTNGTVKGPVNVPHLTVGGNASRREYRCPFFGEIADVRVWSKALTVAEVKNSMNTVNMNQMEGLVLDLPLDEQLINADGEKTFQDLSANNNTMWNYNLTWMTEEEVDVQLEAEYAENGTTRQDSEYSIAILPDTQFLASYYPEKLNSIFEWIASKVEEENLQMVIGVGDIVNWNNDPEQWERASAAYNMIEGKVPYIYVPGNHDYDMTKTYRDMTEMNKYFPLSMFQALDTYGGSYSEDNNLTDDVANTWQQFEVNGNKYLVLALEFGPRDSVLEWANEVVAAHPNHQVIVVTHGYLYSDGTRINEDDGGAPKFNNFTLGETELPNDGDGIWNKFVKKHENIIMVLSGHIECNDNIVMSTDIGEHGNEVKQFLMDAQDLDLFYGGFGMVAMMNFSNDGQTVELTYYSPSKDRYLNALSQFTFTLPKWEPTNKFTGMTLNLDGAIGFNFYIDSTHTLSENAYVEFELPKTGTQTVALKDAVKTSNGLKFTCLVPAKEITDTIKATLYDGETVIDTQSVSVRDYAEIIIKNEKNSTKYAEATSLMKAMLHYGSYAQNLFTYNTEDLANKNYTADDKVQEVTVEDLVSYAKGYQGLSRFGRLAGATLVLEGETTLRMFFEFEDSANVEGLKFIVNGTEKSFTKSGNYYIVECENIGAKDLDLENQVVVMVGEETKFVASCSAMTFCYNALNNSSTSEGLQNVAKALYLYNGEANRYMEGEVVSLSKEYDAISGTVLVGANSGFTVQNGRLTPTARLGEGKIMVKEQMNSYTSVSVDIYPGASNIINSGIYIGASGAEDAQDKINGLAVMVESHFTGWDDAPNRADIVIGNFPTWQEYHRKVSENLNNNIGLFTNGQKQPVNLKVDIEGKKITVTLSLVADPTKSVTTEYTYTGDYDLTVGQVGLRSLYDDSSFDNFKVVTSENETMFTFDETSDMSALDFYHSAFGLGVTASVDNTIALHKTASFINGTLSAELNTNGNKDAGIIFGADADGKNYYLYRLTADRFVELVKVEDGTETILDQGYLSAGHINTNFNRLEVVKEGNSIYCYYDNRFDKMNCYAVYEDENPLTGTGIGLWSATAGTVFRNVTCSNDREIRKADVLIFGHSYTEMWWDFETYFPEYKSIDDIGIGGSVAVHWESLVDEVIAYEPELGIYNIGINELTGGAKPEDVVTSIEKSMLAVKEALPEFKVVLVSVSHCPARSKITEQISETNALMRNLAASYDWMYYAEAEYLFCTDASDPLSTNADLFIDGLHPSAEGYQLLATSIKRSIMSATLIRPDVFSAVFNEDGTAKDAISETSLRVMGTGMPTVTYNESLNKYEAKFSSNAYGIPEFYTKHYDSIKTSFTLEAYVKVHSLNTTTSQMLFGGEAAGGFGLWYNKAGKLYTEMHNGIGYQSASKEVDYGDYVHTVVTYDGATLKLYANGVLLQETSVTGALKKPSDGVDLFCIGADALNNTTCQSFADCTIATANIYSEALTAEQVSALYQAYYAVD